MNSNAVGGASIFNSILRFIMSMLRAISLDHLPVCPAVFLAGWLMLTVIVPGTAAGTIRFEDVSQPAGVYHFFPTAASAWGDINGDGWADLWVSNHHMREPSLYLNQRDGTFVDIAATAVVGVSRADFHGAAWADFDKDGDQDLIVLSGGGAGRGIAANLLLVNQDGKLHDEAKRMGVDYSLGRGRTPLWLDADGDGTLDLLVMNRAREGGTAPSAIFLQTETGFVSSNERFGFNPSGERTTVEKIKDLASNAIRFRFRKGPGQISAAEAFAQLADISGDGVADLLAYVKPMRIYSTKRAPFEEITNQIEFPNFPSVQDIAVEDFNGDGRMDMFLVRAFSVSDVAQTSPLDLVGSVKNGSLSKPNEIRFRCGGTLTLTIQVPWHDPSDPQNEAPPIFPGKGNPVPADGRPITLAPGDPSIQSNVTLSDRSISIHFTPDTMMWTCRISYPEVNFKIAATQPIDQLQTSGFTPSKGDLANALLMNQTDRLGTIANAGLTDRPSPCKSLAAGDFDNDMDIDLYMVCAEPTRNIPNRLFQNDGSGRFIEIPDAGGASGSGDGRGNQVSLCDYDRDGFLDLFVTNGDGAPPFSDGPHQLFHNEGNENHWLEIDLRGTASNRDGIGAVVELLAGGVKQKRIQDGGMHSFSQDDKRIHFGLGPNTKADELIVRWPSGIVQEMQAIPANQILTITETGTAR